jgi:hypothetical protein
MIHVDTSGVPQFNRELTLAFAEFERQITVSFQAKILSYYFELVYHTPQYSGDLASNWNVSRDSPDTTYSEHPDKYRASAAAAYEPDFEPKYMGHPDAVNMAVSRAQDRVMTLNWRDRVFFHNPTPIAEKVENHRIILRPVNLVNGRVEMAQHMANKYSWG